MKYTQYTQVKEKLFHQLVQEYTVKEPSELAELFQVSSSQAPEKTLSS